MPAASSSPLLSLRSPAWKDVTGPGWQHQPAAAAGDRDGKKQVGSRRFVITEKAPTRAFSWLKAATTAFTFKTLLRHYTKWTLTLQ